eukprot:2458221-Prorocentrum_lima.AAC.1
MRPTTVPLLVPLHSLPRASLAGPPRRRPTPRSPTLRQCLATGRPLAVPPPLTTALPRLPRQRSCLGGAER